MDSDDDDNYEEHDDNENYDSYEDYDDGTERPDLWWCFDAALVEADIHTYDWLKAPDEYGRRNLCGICRYINFEFLFTSDLVDYELSVNGRFKTYEVRHLRMMSLSTLRENQRTCIFCKLVWGMICRFFGCIGSELLSQIPWKDQWQRELKTKSQDEVWYTMQPRLSRDAYPIEIGLVLGEDPTRSIELRNDITRPDPSPRPLPVSLWPEAMHIYPLKASLNPPMRLIGLSDGCIDFDIIRKWLQQCRTCQNNHPSGKASVRQGLRGVEDYASTFFINIVEQKIEQRGVRDTDYAILSYQWGKDRFLTLRESNKKTMMAFNGLKGMVKLIPRTIRDSMTVCSRLGFRYLWVDSLCISQDSDMKMDQIQIMDQIYSNAELTIVAADGSGAHSPLPGVLPGSRKVLQYRATLGRGMEVASGLPWTHEVINNSLWNTRGWTYQERRLSKKILAFGPDQAHFMCNHGQYAESAVSYSHPTSASNMSDFQRRFSHFQNGLEVIGLQDWQVNQKCRNYDGIPWDFEMYAQDVHEYTGRSLTYASDVLNALTGILTATSNCFRTRRFLYGLPVSALSLALSWMPQDRTAFMRRSEEGKHYPSWSWAGWSGQVRFGTPSLDHTGYGLGFIPCIKLIETGQQGKSVPTKDASPMPGDIASYKDFGLYVRPDSGGEKIRYYKCEKGFLHCWPGSCDHNSAFVDEMPLELHLQADIAEMYVGSAVNEKFQPPEYSYKPIAENMTLYLQWIFAPGQKDLRIGYIWRDQAVAVEPKTRQKMQILRLARNTPIYEGAFNATDFYTDLFQQYPGKLPDNGEGDAHYLGWCMYEVMLLDKNNERLGLGKIHARVFDYVSRKAVEVILR